MASVVDYSREVMHSIQPGQTFRLIPELTAFSPARGGCVGDSGWIESDFFQAKVLEAIEPVDGLIVLICEMQEHRNV